MVSGGLHCTALDEDCTFDVEGFSFAGLPGVVIGRNPQLAWAFTNLSGDSSDLVVEQNAGEGAYRRDGACLAYKTRTETFKVAGGEPFEMEVRESVHAPSSRPVRPRRGSRAAARGHGRLLGGPAMDGPHAGQDG